MESEFIDQPSEKEKKVNSPTTNISISITIIVVVALLIFFGFSFLAGGPYAMIAGLIFGIWSVPVFIFLTGFGFLLAKKQKEGATMLIIGACLLLFGGLVCSTF